MAVSTATKKSVIKLTTRKQVLRVRKIDLKMTCFFLRLSFPFQAQIWWIWMKKENEFSCLHVLNQWSPMFSELSWRNFVYPSLFDQCLGLPSLTVILILYSVDRSTWVCNITTCCNFLYPRPKPLGRGENKRGIHMNASVGIESATSSIFLDVRTVAHIRYHQLCCRHCCHTPCLAPVILKSQRSRKVSMQGF